MKDTLIGVFLLRMAPLLMLLGELPMALMETFILLKHLFLEGTWNITIQIQEK